MILLLQNSKPNHIHTDQSDIWLNTVSFENENILISAPSGTGKTSIFNILYLKDNQFEGSYLIDGTTSNELDDTAISNLRTNKISAIFQDLKLFEELSLLDNILLKNQLTGHYSKDQINQLIDQLGLKEQTHQSVKTLSYGQRQRVCFIRALCQPFDYIIMDEPFSHLDTANIKVMTEILKEELEYRNANMILLSLEQDYGLSFHKTYHL